MAITSAGIFAGAALYINLVEHPAAMHMGTRYAGASFPDRYHRGAAMQAPLALAGLVSGVVAWVTGSGWAWLAGAILLGSVVPVTLLLIGPSTNRHLLDPSLDLDAPRTRALLSRWWWLHGVRTVLSLIAFALFAVALVK
ncbi:MAG: DUF1772 domain-containing protein [Dehalococcoidia bacterium]